MIDNNQNIKLNYNEALNKLENILNNIRKNLKSLNGLLISNLKLELKDNDQYIYNEIDIDKKFEYDNETIKLVFLENVGFEVSKLEDEIFKKNRIYCHLIANLRGLKRVILAKIKHKLLNTILSLNDFKYYEDRIFNNLYDFRELIYSKIRQLMEVKTSFSFPYDDLNEFYTGILNNLNSLKEIFLANIIDERGC